MIVENYRLIVTLFFIGQFCYAQTVRENNETDSLKRIEATEIFYKVDKIAEFPGGMGKFYEYISVNIKYPDDAVKEDVEGKVLVEFVIDSNGDIVQDEVKVKQGILKSCDDEAIRLIKGCPKWKPAYIKKLRKNVPMRMVIPIAFKLE